MKMPNNSTPEEILKNATEKLKQKLEAENYAVIDLSDELKLPLHMEYEWFKSIYNYEKRRQESGYTTVYILSENLLLKNYRKYRMKTWKNVSIAYWKI